MRLAVTALLAALIFAIPAFAQVQRSSNPGGVQIQGNTDLKAAQQNSTAIASGQDNSAKNTAASIKSGTQIQGNTRIDATQKHTSAVATGKGNTAGNEAGQIGGK